MQTKLTLSIDHSLLVPIKAFARSEQTSVSRLVENYLKKLLTSPLLTTKSSLHPITNELSGSMKGKGKVDVKKLKEEYLMEKYG